MVPSAVTTKQTMNVSLKKKKKSLVLFALIVSICKKEHCERD